VLQDAPSLVYPTLRKLAAILDDGKVVKAVDALLPADEP
jgi:hypothetical protein